MRSDIAPVSPVHRPPIAAETAPWFKLKPMALRAALLAIVCGAVGLALVSVSSAGPAAQDIELARLLRAMATLKLAFAVPLFAAAWLRFGWPVSPAFSAAYIACAAGAAAAIALMFQLSAVGPAALLFHAALIGAAILAHADTGLKDALTRALARRRAANP